MRIKYIVPALLLVLFGCGPISGPQPPTPTPQPIPDPQCSVTGEAHSCWHWPPDSTMPLYACPVKDANGGIVGVVNVTGGPAQCPTNPAPTPTPTPVPVPTDCNPILDAGLMPPLNSDDWSDAGFSPSFQNDVTDAVKKAQAACPTVWNQPASASSCLTSADKIDQGYLLISKQLQYKGLRAAQAVDASGRLYDHLYICLTSTKCESWKLFEYNAGCLTGNPYKGTYLSPQPPSPTPVPTPTPTPIGGCTAPVTPKVDKFNDLAVINGWFDATAQFYNGETRRWDGVYVIGYCDSIGFVNRLHCPARMECGEIPNPVAVKCEERVACERLGVSGDINGEPKWVSDGPIIYNDNIFKAKCNGGTKIKICSSDGFVCSPEASC